MSKKRIKFRVGDLLVKYDSGKPEQAVLLAKHPPYYNEEKQRQIPTTWELLGWEFQYYNVLESFLKTQIKKELIDYYPAKK
jgi:hypothetical protein